MCPHRRGGAEGVPEQLLLGCVGKVLLAPHDVRHPHLDVVNGVGEQEHRRAVAAQQREVLDAVVGERHLTADHVVDDRHSLVGRAEAQHPAGSRAEPAVA